MTVSAIWSGVWRRGEDWKHAEVEHRTRQKHLNGPFPDLKRTPAWNRFLLPEVKPHCGPTGRIFSRSGGGQGWTEVQGEGHSDLAQCKCSVFVLHFLVVRGVKQPFILVTTTHIISSLLRNLPLCTPPASERYGTTSGSMTRTKVSPSHMIYSCFTLTLRGNFSIRNKVNDSKLSLVKNAHLEEHSVKTGCQLFLL